jgi:SAM-dependent methyltransferase
MRMALASCPTRSSSLAIVLSLLLAAPACGQVRSMETSPDQPDPLSGTAFEAAAPEVAPPVEAPVGTPVAGTPRGPNLGDEIFRPEIGQAGKDVIWVPTPDALVSAMVTVAGVTERDYVVDLGSGDGRIAIAAARDFGARAHGIEYNADMVALARRNAERERVSKRVTFQRADIFETDFTDATVVTLYLLPSLNLKLKDSLLAMKPGTRIVSHAFGMGDWEPDETINTDDATGYFWVVPASVAGRWAFEVGSDRFAAELQQTYQKLEPARGAPFREGRVTGNRIFLVRSNGQELEGELRGDQILGRGWVASRIRPAA